MQHRLTMPVPCVSVFAHVGEDNKINETFFQFLLRGPRKLVDANPINWLPITAWQVRTDTHSLYLHPYIHTCIYTHTYVYHLNSSPKFA